MKKSFYLIAGIAMAFLALFSSCRKVNPINPSGIHEVTLNASTEDASKTYLSGYDVLWSSGDKINVNGSEFNLVSGAGTKNAVFHGTASGSSFLAGYKAKSNNGTTVTFEIPADQSGYTADMDGKLPMVGYAASENDKLKFKNVVNIIKIALTGASTDVVTKIELSSTANLTGEFTATSDCVPTSIATGGKVITVNLNSGITLSGTAQYVYVIIPKLSERSNITMKFTGTKSGDPAKLTFTINDINVTTVNKIYTANITANLVAQPYFTVNSSGKKVEFSKGYLWYEGTVDGNPVWHIENNQTSYQPTTNGSYVSNHISHFYWDKDWQDAIATGCQNKMEGCLFTNATVNTSNPDFIVDGETGWRSLSSEEFIYLCGSNDIRKGKCGCVCLYEGSAPYKVGFFIFSDKSSFKLNKGFGGGNNYVSSTEWNDMLADNGVVFLPLSGQRYGGSVNNIGNDGSILLSDCQVNYRNWCSYWTYGGESNAYLSGFDFCRSIRLVRDLN